MRALKTKGLHHHRLKGNPEEKRFAEEWMKENRQGKILAYLLTCGDQHGRPLEPSDRDHTVAATVIQWLGSPVGQNWLKDLGYTKKL